MVVVAARREHIRQARVPGDVLDDAVMPAIDVERVERRIRLAAVRRHVPIESGRLMQASTDQWQMVSSSDADSRCPLRVSVGAHAMP